MILSSMASIADASLNSPHVVHTPRRYSAERVEQRGRVPIAHANLDGEWSFVESIWSRAQMPFTNRSGARLSLDDRAADAPFFAPPMQLQLLELRVNALPPAQHPGDQVESTSSIGGNGSFAPSTSEQTRRGSPSFSLPWRSAITHARKMAKCQRHSPNSKQIKTPPSEWVFKCCTLGCF